MDHKTASVLNDQNFLLKKISFSQIPDQSRLFIDFQKDSEGVKSFYPSKNKPLTNLAEDVLDNYQIERNRLCEILESENKNYDAGKKTFENIEKLRAENCVAVLTGQQAGLFTGAAYTIYKALSAIKLSEKLTSEGINAVPVFWIASEDHDFEEISQTFFINKSDNFSKVENKAGANYPGTPIGYLKLDGSIEDSIKQFIGGQSQTYFTKELVELLGKSYSIGETFSSAFAKVLAKIFDKYGLVFISPINQKLRQLSSPIYQKVLNNIDQIRIGLLNRGIELVENGYHQQVLVEKDFFPFFYIDRENQRNALRLNEETGKIKSTDSRYEFEISELQQIAVEEPERLSPNALLRPVVQDFLFPTVRYYGGSAEIAYFAQNSVIYKALGRPVTPIFHRSSFTIIQGRHRRTMNQYGLDFNKLFRGSDQITGEIVEEHLNPETAEAITETIESVDLQIEKLDDLIKSFDPTLSEYLENREKKIHWHFENFRKKFHQSEKLRNEIIIRKINSLFTNLFPKQVLQERNINFLFFINIFGEEFLNWLYAAVEPDETEHQLIIF